MNKRLAPLGITSASGQSIAGLLLAAWCTTSLAATGVDIECPETNLQRPMIEVDIPMPLLNLPTLTVDIAEHGVDSSAAIDDAIVDDSIPPSAAEVGDEADESDSGEAPTNDVLPTATRLPGVSEADLPSVRRQMYRTDI